MHSSSTFKRALRSTFLVATALTTFDIAAYAQTAAEPAQDSGEIVVTAQRRAETLTKVAASISAFTGESLEQRGIVNLSDIQQQVPSISFGPSLGAAQISIRGVGLTINTGAGEPGVAVHLDGVYEPRPVLSGMASFDLERIEVLRGPQGTLYGRNATGGAVNFISRAPTDSLEGYVKASYANYDEVHGEAVISGPLTTGLRARVGVTYTNRGKPFIKNIVPGQRGLDERESFGTRARLSADLGENLTADIGFTYLKENGSLGGFTPRAPLTDEQVAVNPEYQTGLNAFGPYETAQTAPILRRTAASPTLTLKWDLGDVTVRSLTGYTHIKSFVQVDGDGSGGDLYVIPSGFRTNQVTQELTVSGASDQLDWVVGGFYLHEKYRGYQDLYVNNDSYLAVPDGSGGFLPILIFPEGSQLYQHYTEERTSYANFADLTYRVTDQVSLKAGGRYSIDTVKMTQTQGTIFPAPTGRVFGCEGLETEKTFKAFTPKLGVQFEPDNNTNLYGTISRGYKSGGVNFGTCGDLYDPEKITSYEIGFKGKAFSNQLTFSLAAFHYDYRDLQVYQLRPVSAGSGTFIDNAPKARIRGVEGELTFSPDGHWSINAAGAYLDARYQEYSNTDSTDLTATVQDLSGNRITKSPKFTGNVGVQYRSDEIGNLGRFTVRGEMYHSSSQFFTEFNTAQDYEKGYTLYNAFLILTSINEKYDLRVFGKNLSDKRYVNFLTRNPFAGVPTVSYGAPRQYGVELTARF